MFSDSKTSGSASRNLTLFGPTALVPVTNPFIPADLRALLATRQDPSAPFILNQRFLGIDERTHEEQFETTQYVVGMEGSIASTNLYYDIYFSRDRTKAIEHISPLVSGTRLNQLLQSETGGQEHCMGGYNPFGLANSRAISTECIAFLTPDSRSHTRLTRNNIDGLLSGSVDSSFIGEIAFSIFANHRKDTFDYVPASDIQSNDALGVGQSSPTNGATQTDEIGTELLFPITANNANISLGFRHSRQNITGTENSWHIGTTIKQSGSTEFYASMQKAIRAPNIGELFSARIGNEITVGDPGSNNALGDPCDIRNALRSGEYSEQIKNICRSQGLPENQLNSFQHTTTSLPTVTSGNTGLNAENARIYSFGMNWKGNIASHPATVNINLWQIKVNDVINTINGNEVLNRCFNPAINIELSEGNTFCQLIIRESDTGTVSQISTSYLNLASLKTSGVDLEGTYEVPLYHGDLRSALNLGWMHEYKEQSFPDDNFNDFTGTIGGPANRVADNDVHPRLKFIFHTSFESESYTLNIRWKHMAGMAPKSSVFFPDTNIPGTRSVNYVDVFATTYLSENLSFKLTVGVNNLFKQAPPTVDGQTGQTRIGTYDVTGRSYYLNLEWLL